MADQPKAGVAVQTNPNLNYRANLRPEVFALLPQLKPGMFVLEVGCGEGVFCRQITDAAEIWGIEPYAPSAEIAAQSLHRAFAATYDEVEDQLPLDYFDLVICNDVIEHMTDHDTFLRKIQKHMKKNSLLVGSLPNVRFSSNLVNLILLKDWHYQDAGILDRTHFRFFTFRSVRRSLEEAGFVIKRMEGLNKGQIRGFSARAIAERLFILGMDIISLGRAGDIRFLQVGFLASPR